MTEIPLVYPHHVNLARRYVVNAETKRLQRQDVPKSPAETTTTLPPPMEEALPGAASVSSVQMRGKDVVLTTSARLENPGIICVALSWTQDALESPATMELDLTPLDELGQIVSIQAFSQGEPWIRLLLVDFQGTIITILITDKLVPVEQQPIQVLKTTDYIDDLPVVQEVTGSELQTTMVSFLSPTVVVLALAPFILTVDLESEECAMWSETQCLEDMRARASSFGTMFSNVSDLLLGRLEQGVMDMPPTAALCLTSTANPLFDPTFLITLHSDASIRKWKLDPAVSLLPLEVTTLEVSASLPHPSTWSDGRNAVSLCARLYQQSYALAVHVKTEGLYNKDDNHPSDCHLWVLHGSQEPDPRASCLALAVPKHALALVGMGFLPTQSRCTFSVLFEAQVDEDRSATMEVTYPPSSMSIVSPEPLATGHGSLDKVAGRERARIRSLLYGPSLLEEHEEHTADQVLHELDAMYLKYLFRPMFPRGTGTVLPPSEACIRRALGKMVHGYKKEPSISVELETVRTMYEWRHRENRKLMVISPTRAQRQRSTERREAESAIVTATSPFSVYESYVQDDTADDVENDMDVDGEDDDDWERLELERTAEVEAHENRWRRFLLQVWEEEQILRLPLCVQWMDHLPIQVLIRAGVTTVTEHKSQGPVSGPWAVLDGAGIQLLECIEQDKDKSARLYAVEHQVAMLVSKAQLAVAPLNQAQSFVQELTALGRWAWSEEEDEAGGISDAEHERLEEAVSTLSASQLVAWLQATPKDNSGRLVGLELFDEKEDIRTGGRITWSQKQVANCQLRHAACSLSVRCVDSVRRLQLSRCLLLLDLVEGSHAKEAALRAYLHSIAVLWTSSQRVAMPSTAMQTKKRQTLRLGESPDSSSPPNKRLSFGDDSSSILTPASSTMTTMMDVLIIDISQTMDENSSVSSSPIGAAILLSRCYFRLAFSARGDIPIGKPSLLPELGALPSPKDDSIATDYPRLALRLLAPYVACSLPEDSADVVVARKESLAECLLIESHSESTNAGLKSQMRQMACELLVPKAPDRNNAVDQKMIRTAFEALESLRNSLPIGTDVSKEKLAHSLNQIVQSGTSIEIRRLCELETVQSLFTPVAAGLGGDMDGVTRASINMVASTMLHLSRVMYRLTILERHTGLRATDEDGDNPDILLGFISSAINEMGKTFPDEVCQFMPEYGKMWSRLFHHAVLAGHWRQAYSACVRNPKSELRESNFRRLVRSMVDAGSLSNLLEMCTELGVRVSNSSSVTQAEASESVDLYEIASEILAEAISRDVYTVRAASSEPASLSDFQGALYALHASQRQWRRAAQSMDLRYLNAKTALSAGARDFSFNPQSAEYRDGLIVEDLVLAAVGAVNSVELVKDNAHRFLVSGEFGPYNTIPIEGLEKSRSSVSRMKRSRGTPERGDDEDKLGEGEDRLSKFMTVVQLEGRAIRSIALRALFFDRSSDPAFAKTAYSREFDSSKLDIDELFKHGYYRYGLLLSKAWSKNCEALTGSSRPGGQDLFYDSLVHMLETYLMPLSADARLEGLRPSLNQLHVALDEVGLAQGAAPSYIVTARCNRIADLQAAAVNTTTVALIRKLTLAYSTAETPVAVDVARCFLDQGGRSKIPAWLERLLIGADACSSSHSSGLFARRPKADSGAYLGDPATLVSMYTKRGMFAEACDIVTATISGLESQEAGSRESKAASRLPEKGDIDYVPYQTIDLLWNLIDLVFAKRVLGKSEEHSISESRDKMEAALAKHFALTKISEMGMRSARALQQGASS